MKTYSYIIMLAAFAFALGGCSSAYRTAQTPDAVYYSPAGDTGGGEAASSDNTTVAANDGSDQGQYVTYEDGDNGGYANDYDGYYSERINMFDNPGNYWSLNSYAMMNPWYGGGYSYGLGWNPFAFTMPSLTLAFGAGWPWGGFYSPMAYSSFYNPYFYGGYYGGYGGYYPGYYGYGGKYVVTNPRPAGSYGPRVSPNSRAAVRGATNPGRTTGVSAPRRSFGVNGRSTETPRPVSNSPRRNFRVSSNERPVDVNTNTRIVERSQPTRPVNRPQQVRQEVRQPVERPQRTFENTPRVEVQRSAPSYSAPSSAPVRSFGPRGR